MKIVIIDGQGGKIGKNLVERIKKVNDTLEIYAIGTNSIATAVMLKAGADHGATGENPVIVNSRDADIIIGPIGIVLADSLLGEVSASMAAAVAQSKARKILLPVNKCNTYVVGTNQDNTNEIIDSTIEYLFKYVK